MDRRIKMLLLFLNKRGMDITYEAKASYSEKFDCIVTNHTLKFWYKGIRKNKDTGKDEEYTYVKVITPKNMMYTIKYLVSVKDNKVEAGEKYEEE